MLDEPRLQPSGAFLRHVLYHSINVLLIFRKQEFSILDEWENAKHPSLVHQNGKADVVLFEALMVQCNEGESPP